MPVAKAKTSKVEKEFDVSKYMVTNDIEERVINLADDKFIVKIKPISWSKKNQFIAKAMAFGGTTDGMSFDADFYVKECLKAMIVDAPWGKTTDVFLISINDELGKALETLVPRAFSVDEDEDNEDILKKE